MTRGSSSSSVPAFRNLDPSPARRIVAGLRDLQVLWDEAGVLWLGRGGKDAYGRRNFLDLFSVFTSTPLSLVLHGRHELGSFNVSTFLVRRRDELSVLLPAGRARRVTQPDWRRSRAHVEPTEAEGRSRWRGEGQFLGRELCGTLLRVLAGESVEPIWSRRSKVLMQEIRCGFS